MITVKTRCFSLVRYALNTSTISLDLDDNSNVQHLLDKIVSLNNKALNGLPIRVAVNKEYVNESYVLKDNDEVALIPPVSGG
jgi:molybdopterin converting factor small subunit